MTTAPTVLVIGATGPAGICLVRELLHRQHNTVVYARAPSKIPPELKSNPLLEVIPGELTDTAALTTAVAKSTVVVSLLGPNRILGIQPEVYTSFYRALFDLMRAHDVGRIFAMGTLSIPRPEDSFSLARLLVVLLVWVVAHGAYRTVRAIGRVFQDGAHGLDWTVFRIAGIPGGCDDAAWRRDRADGPAFEGWVGEAGWTLWQRRGALARWLVDAVEDGREGWVRRMPAVSRLKGSARKDA